MNRINSNFTIKGANCAGWLYLPEGVERPPVVVMAHGLGAQRDFGLSVFAEKFVEVGIAAFVFDYRNFGDSEGEPRNLISPSRHLADWKAAISHVRQLGDVDAEKVALWGTSFSGGHVLATAASVPGITAVVSQVPFVDGISTTMLFDLKYQLTGMFHAVRDIFRLMTFRRPHCVPIVADPGEFALMNTPESRPGYMALVPGNSKWKNEAPARILITLPSYRPISHASKIPCPVFIAYAEKDSLIDPKAVEKTAKKIKHSEIVSLPVGHFDPYSGETFDKLIEMERGFLKKHLSA